MNKPVRYILIGLLIVGLILIRHFEDSLFYDPLIAFFKTDHSTQPLPELDQLMLLVHTTLRFLMNTILSLGVIWLVFRSKEILKISIILYASLFVLAFLIFWLLLGFSGSGDHLFLFYIRRFLIQPLFLLLLLPAFYFHKKA